jgi:hypothetical protein
MKQLLYIFFLLLFCSVITCEAYPYGRSYGNYGGTKRIKCQFNRDSSAQLGAYSVYSPYNPYNSSISTLTMENDSSILEVIKQQNKLIEQQKRIIEQQNQVIEQQKRIIEQQRKLIEQK